MHEVGADPGQDEIEPRNALPLHWTPAGVQLVAAYGREDILIRVASQLGQAAPWSDRHPSVHG